MQWFVKMIDHFIKMNGHFDGMIDQRDEMMDHLKWWIVEGGGIICTTLYQLYSCCILITIPLYYTIPVY